MANVCGPGSGGGGDCDEDELSSLHVQPKGSGGGGGLLCCGDDDGALHVLQVKPDKTGLER